MSAKRDLRDAYTYSGRRHFTRPPNRMYARRKRSCENNVSGISETDCVGGRAPRIHGIMQIYRNFIHLPPSSLFLFLFTDVLCLLSSHLVAARKYSSRKQKEKKGRTGDGGEYFQILKKKKVAISRKLWVSSISIFWSHCSRRGNTLPVSLSHSPGVESALYRERKGEKHEKGREHIPERQSPRCFIVPPPSCSCLPPPFVRFVPLFRYIPQEP